MELPVELWSSILQNTKFVKYCERLYRALPKNIKEELMEIYEKYKQKISINILCAIQNKMILYTNGELHTYFYHNIEIKFIRYVKNWHILGKKIDCYVSVSKNIIIFWNASTHEYEERIQIDSDIKDIEFHLTKSIMLVSCDELQVYIFDEDGYTIKTSIQNINNINNDEKIYFFHKTLPEIYIFTLSNLSIRRFIICDYDKDNVILTDIIQTYFNQNYYNTPVKMNEDNSFECIKFDGAANYFCQFRITDTDLEEIKLQKVVESSRMVQNLIIKDFIRIGNYVYFHTNSYTFDEEKKQLYSQLYKQCDEKTTVMYQITNKLSKLTSKNNYLVFVDNDEFTVIDLETNINDCLFNWNSKIDGYNNFLNDFCIL
jgi:hypothetical protein